MLALIEVIVLLVVAAVLITAIMSVGRPVAEMLASKTRFKYDSLGSEAEVKLQNRVAALEEEVRQLKAHVIELQDASEFQVKLLETAGITLESQRGAGNSATLKIRQSENDP